MLNIIKNNNNYIFENKKTGEEETTIILYIVNIIGHSKGLGHGIENVLTMMSHEIIKLFLIFKNS